MVNGWNTIEETEGTETVNVDKIMQLCNSVELNSENMPEKVIDWLQY